jgi:hypothetical protein
MLLLENSSQATNKKKKKKKKKKMLMMMMKVNSSLHCHDSVVFAREASAGFMGIVPMWSSIFESVQRMVLLPVFKRGYRNCDASSSRLKQEEQGDQGEFRRRRRRRRKGNGEGRKERTNT